jgi:hypothetical protein
MGALMRSGDVGSARREENGERSLGRREDHEGRCRSCEGDQCLEARQEIRECRVQGERKHTGLRHANREPRRHPQNPR